ncbi:protein tyrosine phosphatase domain-containing protein 1 [Conger conger]|uniref:protein tyrosine phosphatase domain-containing protein 1 n=1 Tax=Conger conger TaxID=82655 RepID=UPI002A5A8700|nr:protein tyrosine phosphatase domain-containing protein 1 [Conger conger]
MKLQWIRVKWVYCSAMVFILSDYDMEHPDQSIRNGSEEPGCTMAAGVSLQNDLPPSTAGAGVGEHSSSETDMDTPVSSRVPTAKYTKVGETLRHVIPGHMQCSMACGGRACKYENPSRWSSDEQAVKGLYSSWITDNLLAMARPSTEIIEKYNIIDQFHRCGLRTVINLQRPGEHASCGNPLEQESGFTYRPEAFMEAGIYFYNFGWKDYGVASLTTILDMVKVMSFAIQEGKMAIHCHAGLGRTGVLLACYLVFTTRMSADQAILFVRAKRPNSIQTRGQLLCVREFAQFLVPLRSVFSCSEPKANPVTLSQYLTRQRHLLHGYEARQLKNVPKMVHLACKLLLDIAEDRQVVEDEIVEVPDLTAEVEKTVSQQALQQLGKEMMGKGITVPSPQPPGLERAPSVPAHDAVLCSDYDLDPLWSRQNACRSNPRPHLRRSLSYSESDLLHLGVRGVQPFTNALGKHCLSQEDLPEAHQTSPASPLDVASPAWEERKSRWPLLGRRRPLRHGQRSLSLGSAENTRNAGEREPALPSIVLPAELSLDARRLLVAQALTVDLDKYGEEYKHKVSDWQTELNSREGTWERLCMEKDPRVLASLMWSWLEQLKEPVITKEDIQAMDRNRQAQQPALNSIDKGSRQTLMCVLHCMGHLLTIPEEVEDAFLARTIKAFTKIVLDSEDGLDVYRTLKEILKLVLHEMRMKAIEEPDTPCSCILP